jgi:hypothetical protein
MLGTQRKFVDYISVRDGFCHCCKRIFINGLRLISNIAGRLKNQLLPYNTHLRMADGSPVVPLGIVKVPLQIDNQIVYQEMLVADVEIPAVLG